MLTLEEKLYDDKLPLKEVINPDEWMTAIEVGERFGVKSRTVTRWDDKLNNVRKFKTPGGHLRFYKPDVLLVLEQYEDSTPAPRK